MRKILAIMMTVSVLWARSVWNSPGASLYDIRVTEGDIVMVVFSEKTTLRLREEQRISGNENTTGLRAQGGVFNFYPEGEVIEQTTRRNQRQYSLNNEKRFVLPARVVGQEGQMLRLEGRFQSDIAGQMYSFLFQGETMRRFLQADMTIRAASLYNLRFRLAQEDRVREPFLTSADLVFRTNFTDIRTNLVITNAQTNVLIETNQDAYELTLRGISEERETQLILQYLNRLVNSIFRE